MCRTPSRQSAIVTHYRLHDELNNTSSLSHELCSIAMAGEGIG